MKFRDCTSMNSTENIQEGYRNGLSKTALGFENCKQQLLTLTMCLPACIWAQITRIPFNYTITAQTLRAKCDDYQFQRLIVQFPASGKNYRIASVFIIIKTLSTRTCIITIYSAWKVLALPVLLLCELIRSRKILRITIQLQPQQFVFPLKTRVESFLLTRLHIY